MASKDHRKKDLQRAVSEFLPAFAAESDRGCVLLVAAIAEGHLEEMLRAKLVKVPEKEDALLDLHFAPKINLAYRIGLISENLCRHLIILKDIRNHFAHNIFDCDFENHYVRAKLSELGEGLPSYEEVVDLLHTAAKDVEPLSMVVQETKAKTMFLLHVCSLLVNLDAATRRIEQRINPAQAEPHEM